jgi:hypothetical protein
MKSMKATFTGVFLVISTLMLHAQQPVQEKYSKVQIAAPVTDRTAFGELMGLLEIDHFDFSEEGDVISEISATALGRLKQTPYKYKILVDDVVANLHARNREYDELRAQGRLPFEETGNVLDNIIVTPSAFELKDTYGGYYRYSEMEDAIDDLVAAYPAIASKEDIGSSYEGRTIWAVKISDNVETDEAAEPDVLFLGIQHAREAIGGASMIFFMQYLCEQYSQDSRIKDLVDNREIYIVVCMNPDGWEHNYTLNINGGGLWRKNRRGNGVDLNRNWDWNWGNCSGATSSCGSATSTSDTYYGPSAFSEPETQVIRDFTYAHNFVAMIDQHAYGPYYSLPFGRPTLPGNVFTADDVNFYKYVPAAMGRYNGMRAGNSPEAVGYEVAGGVKDWMLMGDYGVGSKGKVYGMTGEGGHGTAVGSGGTFWPVKAQIIPLCKGMVHQNLQLLYAAGTHIDLQDASDIAVGSKTGSFSFRATRVGLGTEPVTVSLIPIKNVLSGGTPAVLTSAELPNYYSVHTGSVGYTLPAGLTDGQVIQYAWRIEEGGLTFYDTITKIYHATPTALTVLQDDMESGTITNNWSLTTNGTNWGYTSSGTGFNSSGRAMSESPSGNYANNASRIAGWTNSFNLSDASAAYLTFWVRHRAENFRDKLQVQFSNNSTNGTNGTWVPLVGTSTVQQPGNLEGSTLNGEPALTGWREEWSRQVFDLSAFTGPGNNNVRFRFVFTSNGNVSSYVYRVDDGFYIDDVKLVKTSAALVTLPVQFKSFRGRLLTNETVRLDWEAETDQLHDYFEVERSTDGTSFQTLGRGPAVAPYHFIDPNPVVGNNYYRIKQVDKDGKITYSSTVTIAYTPSSFRVEIYPNPVKDQLRVRIGTAEIAQYRLSLTDLAGRVVYEEKIQTGNGQQDWTIPTATLASQVYLVTVRNSRDEVVVMEKVSKQ